MSDTKPAGRVAIGVLLAISFALVAAVHLPLWQPLLVAAVMAGAMADWHDKLAARLGRRRNLSAATFTVGMVFLILIPFTALAIFSVKEAIDVSGVVRKTLKEAGGEVEGLRKILPDSIEKSAERVLGYLPPSVKDLDARVSAGGGWLLSMASSMVSAASQFTFSLVMMLIAFYFLLRDGQQLIHWIESVSPLPPRRTTEILSEFRTTSRSVLGSSLVTGAVQAAVATGGYLIARAPSPVFFGLLTLFASFIPSVGTSIVALPLAGLLFLMGHPWSALFLALWGLLAVGLVDNVVRPILIKGGSNLHGAAVFFSLIGGIAGFGAIGLILGPLALTFFVTVVRIARR
ncbi:MAG TPA: AI-2E family transporter [Polyangia bacterium]|jgi:predicted PurR-regulated permease PerM|nr:AI-2E family transporter [Polyangia bacterium]